MDNRIRLVRLYTWLDVEYVVLKARYAGQWPKGVAFNVYSDGLEVGVANPEAARSALACLSEWFGPRYDPERSVIRLESSPGRIRELPVVVEDLADPTDDGTAVRPTFSRMTLFPETESVLGRYQPTPLPPDTPPVIVFYSYKQSCDGVGGG